MLSRDVVRRERDSLIEEQAEPGRFAVRTRDGLPGLAAETKDLANRWLLIGLLIGVVSFAGLMLGDPVIQALERRADRQRAEASVRKILAVGEERTFQLADGLGTVSGRITALDRPWVAVATPDAQVRLLNLDHVILVSDPEPAGR